LTAKFGIRTGFTNGERPCVGVLAS
jgi:hypothetical protein